MADDAKPVSINDVAAACDCSIATVSLVLNGRGKISAATRKRVLKAAERLGYVPNLAGRSLRLRRTSAIGLFFYPSCAQLFRNVFYAEVMEAMEEQVGAAGYDLLLCGSDFARDDSRPLQLARQRRIDAAVMLGAFPAASVARLHETGVPLLLLDSNVDDLPVDSITTDGYSAGRMVIDYLHGRGHRNIVMLAYEQDDYNSDTRVRGFLAGLEAHGLPARHSVLRNFKLNDEGLPLLLRRLRSPAAPTAVVCVNDNLAVFMMQHVRAAGFTVPEEVSFVGYDDDTYARECVPPLTTVAVNKRDLGRAGAENLLRRLAEPAAPVSKVRLPVHLVERNSVAKIGR